jgi:hypothetical protein
MGKAYLIDTNILIGYTGDLLPEKAHSFVSGIIDQQFAISVINKNERLEVLNPYDIYKPES